MAVFRRNKKVHLLLYIGETSDQDLGWYAYLLPKDRSYNLDFIDLKRSFNNLSGSYIFSSKAVDLSTKDKADNFVDIVHKYISSNFDKNDRCLIWSENFNLQEPVYALCFNNEKSLNNGKAIQWTISSNLRLHWDGGCTISYNKDGYLSLAGSIGLKNSAGLEKDYSLKNMKIPFQGPGLGCIESDLQLSLDGDFDDLDLSLRYFAPKKEGNGYCSQRYPLLPQEESDLLFKFRIDPTDPLNKTDPASFRRSGLAFASEGDAPLKPLATSFVTTAGRKVTLTPVIGDEETSPARLVFAGKNTLGIPGNDYYLVPHGDFALGVEGPPSEGGSMSLLCGLSATESIIIALKSDSHSGDRLRFKAGMPALSASFPAEGAVLEGEAETGKELICTSWATLVAPVPQTTPAEWNNPSKPWYDIQPEGAPLFSKGEDSSDLLNFHQVGISLMQGEDLYLPLVPYGSIKVDPKNEPFDAQGIADFELKVLGPGRKNLIGNRRRALSRADRRRAQSESADKSKYVTPQGFIVTVGDDGVYTDLLFARTGRSSEPADLKIKDPSSELQEALQTNQLFLVATNNLCLGSSEDKFSNLISVGGWDFRIDVPAQVEGDDYRNVMILKFCRGSLQELVKKPDLWAQADDFNDPDKKDALSLWLQEYIDDAVEKAGDVSSKEGDLFAKLVDIAGREDWNGILLLKVKIEGLPSNLSGIMAGVDKERFFAHYLGIEANHIDSSAIDIKGQSSVFGAVYYSDSSYISAMDGDFYFRVKDLGALFENSALKSFESRVELVMKQLMDHPVLRITTDSTKQDTTSIVFKGSCQKKEDGSAGGSEDGEDIVFVMDSDESYSFYLDSNILRKVEVVKAQMSMAEAAGFGSGESARSITRFDFWGFMDFAALEYPGTYLFCWMKVPGSDDNRLKEYLGRRYNIDWVSTGTITKTDDKTIEISHQDKNVSIILNDDESKAQLKIDDIPIDEFIVKNVNGELYVYPATASGSTSGIGESRSAVLMPLGREASRSCPPIPVDMEVSNDIWELPDTFAYTVVPAVEKGPEEFSTATRSNTPPTVLFDIFSYGNEYYIDDKNEWAQKDEARKGLYFSGLGLLMSYTEGAEAEKAFTIDLSRMAFDPEKSTAREGSLARQFGLKVEGFDRGDKECKPDGGGFIKVETKSRGPGLSNPDGQWYGLRFGLNMGTLGELAGKACMTSGIRVAWGAGEGADSESHSVFVGIKLPGPGGVKVFDLQGFMKLSVGAVRLGIIGERFVMTLSSIALKLLGMLKIPPSGATSFYLFGSAEGGEKGLGWYAMYKKG